MPAAELLELARTGTYEDFENRCLELLEAGQITLGALLAPFHELQRRGRADRLATLTQMVLDGVDPASDPPAALDLVRLALLASPEHADLRRLMVDLYRRVYGQVPGFEAMLAASGLAGGRPARSAVKLLDLCLTLRPGDPLICSADDRVVEVADIDRASGLFTLRRGARVTTVPAPEIARDYDRIAPDDFRVLRQLRPERLAALIQDDPVAVVIGLIHAHGEHIDSDMLKHELVPRHIAPKAWPAWWNRARTQLKRSPHVVIEGRTPLILRYSAAGRTLEDETWDALVAQTEPADWLATVEGYLREKARRREPPAADLLERCSAHIAAHVAAMRSRRPAEALAAALVLECLGEKGLPPAPGSRDLAGAILRAAARPDELLAGIEHPGLRERALAALRAARPDDWATHLVAWMERAPANMLDRLVGEALAAGQQEAVQGFIGRGLADPARHPELLYWLWKGPEQAAGLHLPGDGELLRIILDTLSALGRTLAADSDTVRAFRQRMRAALALRDYERVRRCLAQASEAAAITLRRQLERLEGVGTNMRSRLLDLLRDVHPHLWAVAARRAAPWEDAETIWCTAAGLKKRTAERDELVNVRMHANARRIGDAAAHGDLSENSEYKFALEERDFLRAQLARLNDELSRARVLQPGDVPEDHVGIGSRVTLRILPDGPERVMTFLGPFEADVEQGIYSYLAPLSQKLLGRQVGDRVRVTLDGREVELEVVAVASGLAAAGN